MAHAEDVLEEAASIRMMHNLRGGPGLQSNLALGRHSLQQGTQVSILHGSNEPLQFVPHLRDRPFG